ncbi:hypothetical protein ACP275_08G027300 [Erythranthe tilingii]
MLRCKNYTTSITDKFASCLEKCTEISDLRKLHACVITRGFDQNEFLCSKLLNSYARFNLLAESKWVFNKIIKRDLSVWNSIIVGCFRADQYGEVLRIYSNLRQKNIGIHGAAITFALKSCVESGATEFGRNLHADAFKFGLSYDPFVGSSLINFYTKCDEIGDAAKVFDEITDRDVVAYTSMITGYAQLGNHHSYNAFRVAKEMQMNGFEPNRVTLVSLLQCASRLRTLENGRSIHGYAIRRQIGRLNEVFETSLLDMYIKCGDPYSGAMIFDKMTQKTTGSWNALITGHLQLQQPLEAFGRFLQMVSSKCDLDLIALANGLLCCADLGYLLVGKAIHCHILRERVNLDLVCTTALIDMYSKCKHLSEATSIFHATEANKDDALFNVMISGYLNNGRVFEALETFQEMVTNYIRPNTGTIISVLSALSDTKYVRASKSIHAYVYRQGLEANTDISNQFVNTYAKCGFIESAKQVFDKIKIKDRVTWTSMMTGFANNGFPNEAVYLCQLMQRENLHSDAITFTCLVQVLNQLGSLILVKEGHARIYRLFLEKDTTLLNSLITTYSKWGKFETARNLFKYMSEKHLSSWNTMIAAYGMHGDFGGALELIEKMKNENVSPDGVTFRAILSACSHNGLVEEGLSAFRSMEREYGIVPSDEHYGCVMDLLGRAGRLEEAYNVLERLPSMRNASNLGALLSACRVHGDTEMGERIGRWILDVGPENGSVYCSVSNMYAGGGRWDEVARVGFLAKGKGLRRTAGYSLIEF